MASRAWASAEAVTVQVLTTTMSAVAGVAAEVQPRSSNWRSMAAPSACVARQPNCSMKNVGIQEPDQKKRKNLHRVRGVPRERREKRIHAVANANDTRIASLGEGEKTDNSGYQVRAGHSFTQRRMRRYNLGHPWPVNDITPPRCTTPRFRL